MSTRDWDADMLMVREGGRDDQIAQAQKEMFDFAEKTLAKLIRMERKDPPHYDYLGIELLCRVDISIIDNADGDLDYFVNEVERGITMVLYPNDNPQRCIDRLADNLALKLPQWLTRVTEVASRVTEADSKEEEVRR